MFHYSAGDCFTQTKVYGIVLNFIIRNRKTPENNNTSAFRGNFFSFFFLPQTPFSSYLIFTNKKRIFLLYNVSKRTIRDLSPIAIQSRTIYVINVRKRLNDVHTKNRRNLNFSLLLPFFSAFRVWIPDEMEKKFSCFFFFRIHTQFQRFSAYSENILFYFFFKLRILCVCENFNSKLLNTRRAIYRFFEIKLKIRMHTDNTFSY